MTNPFLQKKDKNASLKGLTITLNATKRLTKLLESETKNTVFRIKVNGGGCSGFQYTFGFDANTSIDDFILTQGSVTIACDKESLRYIDGGQVDYIDSLMGQYFTIQNPNATANCGCGTSFSI